MKSEILDKKFGRLTVVQEWGKDKHRNILWLCQCECGNSTIQRANTLNMGLVVSCGCYQKEISSKCKIAEKNPMWKGADVGIQALHLWVRSRKPKSNLCEKCNERKPQDLANISQEYKRDVNDFEWLCRKCHMKSDGRMKNRNIRGQFERVIGN